MLCYAAVLVNTQKNNLQQHKMYKKIVFKMAQLTQQIIMLY